MTDYGTTVELLAITPDSEKLIENAGRLCYDSCDKLGANDKWIQKRIEQGHVSLIEHASASFYIKCSRAVTHELIRHRIGAYSQRSQRYVKESEPSYVFPPEIQTSKQQDYFIKAMIVAWESYNELLKHGIKPEIARYVLPNACFTEIICTWNFREIRHIIQLRTSKTALPEIQEVAGKIKDIMKVQAPKVFGDL